MKTMRYSALALAFIIGLVCTSCNKRRANELIQTLDLQDRKATAILLGKEGSESQKLDLMIRDKMDSALLLTAQQQGEYDAIIGAIEAFPSDDLQRAPELKDAAVLYYTALKNLYGYSQKEIKQQQLLLHVAPAQRDSAQDELLRLSINKQDLFERVYRADSVFFKAKEAFEEQHKL